MLASIFQVSTRYHSHKKSKVVKLTAEKSRRVVTGTEQREITHTAPASQLCKMDKNITGLLAIILLYASKRVKRVDLFLRKRGLFGSQCQ